MKVAYMLGSLNIGGIEILACDIFENSKDKGIDLICIFRKKGTLYESFRKTGIPLIEINFKKVWIIKYIHSLRKLLVKERINLIHCHTVMDAFLGYVAKIGLNIKLVISFHGRFWKSNDFNGLFARFIISQADKICFVSHSLRVFYIDRLKLKDHPKLTVLENGISLKKFDINNFNSSGINKELNISKNSLTIGTIGNFTSGKDQMTICRFLKVLKEITDDFHFLFVGLKAPKESHIYEECLDFCDQNNLVKNVHFLGLRNDIPEILSNLNAFIFSTAHDTFGISVIEAMYVKIPVFVNDHEVMLEITDHGKHAVIYRSGDEYDLLEKFTCFLSDRGKYTQKAESASEFVRTHYSIDVHLNRLKQIYEEVLIQ